MWIKAFVFSLKVMKKSLFKYIVPTFFLSLLMLFLSAFMAHIFRASFNIIFESHGMFYAVFAFISISAIVLWIVYGAIFKLLYPLIRSRVLFEGFRYLHPEKYTSYTEIKEKHDGLKSVSVRRFSSQRFTSILACFLPVVAIILFYAVRIQEIIWIVLAILYINCLIPVVRGYLKYFYSECRLITSSKNIVHTDKSSTISSACTNWKSIIAWKAILCILYLVLLLLLGYWMVNVQGMGSYYYSEEIFSTTKLYHVVLGFSHFIYGFAIAPFFSPFVQLPYAFSVPRYFQLSGMIPVLRQIGFLVLLGLMTTFFFFVENLSTVYFFQQNEKKTLRQKGEK